MTITALVTHYNKPPELLKRCIDSIEKFGLDYVIVDDGSEKTGHLSEYKNVIYLKENVGTYKAFRIGIESINTLYTMRVDADDYISGVPDIGKGLDAYINNIDGKITLDPQKFSERPYAGFNGAVVKTKVLCEMWFSGVRYYGDIINFSRLISQYKCVLNDKVLYVYDKEVHGSITKRKDKQKHIDYAKAKIKEELKD